MKKITIITGHYGCGKTNLAVNLAMLSASEGKAVTIVDLDIVNPYFRTADFRKMFEENNITLIAPDYANTNLDLPSLQFDLEQIAASSQNLIIDVGGDDAGAYALGRFSEALSAYGDELDMFYVVNQRRMLTESPADALNIMYEIETASRLKHTGIVNNTNLGCETTLEIVEQSEEFASAVAEAANLPLVFTTCPAHIAEFSENEDTMPVEIYVKPVWD